MAFKFNPPYHHKHCSLLISLCIQAFFLVGPTLASGPHAITIRSLNLFPEAIAWDPSSHHFVLGSFRHASLHSLSLSGHLQPLVSDPHLPPNSSVLGVAIDASRRRLLAVIHVFDPSAPPFIAALAAYDLRFPPPLPRLFLSPLSAPERPVANDVAVDPLGNAYVTNSAGNFIWKIDGDGRDCIFSNSSIFRSHPIHTDFIAPACGLNGIAYHRDGYFLAVQSNTGKIYKINGRDGTASLVQLEKDLVGADGIDIRSDGIAVVVTYYRMWFLKSMDGWDEAMVYDEIALDAGKFPTGVAVREGKRAYVLYGHMDEGMLGNVDRLEFSVEEVELERERYGEVVWVIGLVGFGLVYFLYWRFQMGKLVKDMNKKRE
ncbi:SMP-30/Gluconolactonase/LRE-like protein region [Cinnamomum micranthum f. kanehirae]|uniref:SMP-30/Gluconolactonase/LRE-like protein region n=1 Tax=Cinnamomum micranthum f. kanehirae TaxID=337451 RepID=A0A3S3MYI9_9MAGN|nr:SMP-30/Gluconolactonase/LRE-like protein region [Cinnamomum micranthum f. kanehirae]